jgi:hypothetical protein
MWTCTGPNSTIASTTTLSCVQFLQRMLWRRRKGHHVRRVPARYSAIGQQHRSQDRPMLSNTSCTALLSPASSAAASLASPP